MTKQLTAFEAGALAFQNPGKVFRNCNGAPCFINQGGIPMIGEYPTKSGHVSHYAFAKVNEPYTEEPVPETPEQMMRRVAREEIEKLHLVLKVNRQGEAIYKVRPGDSDD